jgi:AcrR family transcriptional regulator
MNSSRAQLAPVGEADKHLGKQAEKSRKTQKKIVDAAMALIDEGGFSAASSTRIARQANLSWGVVQHHFGDKRGILLAVLERCSKDYVAFMSDIPTLKGGRARRTRHYVERCWAFYCGKEYKIALEIAFAMRYQDNRFASPDALQPQQKDLIALWHSAFPDSSLDDETLTHLIRHTYIVLTGLVIDLMLEGEAHNADAQLDILSTTLESKLWKSVTAK